MDLSKIELGRKTAEQNCNRGDLDCRWYHGNWALLKSLGVVSTSDIHARELGHLLTMALQEKPPVPYILISGSTDDSLLKIAADTCSRCERDAVFSAVDICATPLELMRMYANSNGLSYSSTRANILDYCPEQSYDIIFTHAFMGYFDHADRIQLVRKWASILKTGGSVVTAQRIRPGNSSSEIRFSRTQSREFVTAALAAAQAKGQVPVHLSRIKAAATEFADRFTSYAITSKPDFERLFLDAGLTINHLDYHSLTRKNNLGGPSVPSGGDYGFIWATKGQYAKHPGI